MKTASPDAVAAMRLFSNALSNCAPLVLQNVEKTSKGHDSVRVSGMHVTALLRVSLAEREGFDYYRFAHVTLPQ